jgi:uncharacterized membrane protein
MSDPHSPQPAPKSRVLAVDVARAVAVLLMIQTHAYDAWVAAAARASPGFQLTRLLGTLPLPMFLMLAGMSLRMRSMRARDEPRTVRSQIMRSAGRIVLAGYALNLALGVLDGARDLDTFLRADVLSAIGLSLLVLACFGLGRSWSLTRASWLLLIASLALCPWLSRLGATVHGPARYLLAPFIFVPGVTRMSVIPLLALCALGALLDPRLLREPRASTFGYALLASAAGQLGLFACAAQGIVMARENIGIVFNGIDLAGRSLVALLASAFLSRALAPLRARFFQVMLRTLGVLGRHSLFVYALHLPFCYGALGRGLKHTLDMTRASLALLALTAFCSVAALAWAHFSRPRP